MTLALAFVLTVGVVSLLLWRAHLQEFAALIVLWGFLVAGTVLLSLFAANGVLAGLLSGPRGRRPAITLLSAALVVVGILSLKSSLVDTAYFEVEAPVSETTLRTGLWQRTGREGYNRGVFPSGYRSRRWSVHSIPKG